MCRTSCQCFGGVRRLFSVRVAVMVLGRGRVSWSTRQWAGYLSASLSKWPASCTTGSGSRGTVGPSRSSRTHFGGSCTSSGIGCCPGGRGYLSNRRFRRVSDHGKNVPSSLGNYQHIIASTLERNIPLRMSLIRFSTTINLVRPELEQPLVQLPRSEIEPVRSASSAATVWRGPL